MNDGVIKYDIEHTTKNTPYFSNYEALQALRSRLFALGLIGEHNGIGFGNLSMRGDMDKTFFITATQTGSQVTLFPEHYTHIRDYDFSIFKVISEGLRKPSSESLSHAMIYELNRDINTVVHIHSKVLWDFMQEIDSLYTTAEYGTLEMVEEIASLYDNSNPFDNNIFVMKGHENGIIVFGKNIEETELTLYKVLQKYIQTKTK